jgi:release factor glutamine methyltransferase
MAERAELPALVREWEPSMALFSGDQGMWAIRNLVPQAAEALVTGGLLAMEVDSRRADLAAAAVRDDGRFTDIETRLDLTGRPRFVVARRQER